MPESADISVNELREWRRESREFQAEVREDMTELKSAVAVLKDRDERDSTSKGKQLAITSATSAIVVGLIEAMKAMGK